MGYHHPADHKVEEKHGVRRQGLPLLRLAVAQELHGGVGRPEEAHGHGGAADEEEHGARVRGQEEHPADDEGDGEREETVAEDADGLEERDMAAEELRVQGDHKSAEPHNHKHL